jgi:hypothetical protein
MTDHRLVADYVAMAAHAAVPLLVEDRTLPEITSHRAAEVAIDQVTKQSPVGSSRRVWAAIFAVLTAALAAPEVQALLGPWAPVATATLAAVLAGWSKASDPRPTR